MIHLAQDMQPAFAGLGGKAGDCPEAERAAQDALSLPLYPGLAPEAVERVAADGTRIAPGAPYNELNDVEF